MKRSENEQFMILHDRKIYIAAWTFKLRKNAATTNWTFQSMHWKFLFSLFQNFFIELIFMNILILAYTSSWKIWIKKF